MIWIIAFYSLADGLFVKNGKKWCNLTRSIVIEDSNLRIRGVKVRFVGGNKSSIAGISKYGVPLHLYSRNGEKHILAYRSVKLEGIYRGIDLVINGLKDKELEFYFYIRKGSDPEKINLAFEGAEIYEVNGDIMIYKEGYELFRIKSIKAYQGSRELKIKPIISGKNLTFNIKGYDRERDMVIDPTFILSSNSFDGVMDVFVDDSGYVYAAGYTLDYLTFLPPNYRFGNTVANRTSAFVVKLSPSMDSVISVAIVSGSEHDYALKVVKDYSGNVLIVGFTQSLDFAPSRTVYGTTSYPFYDAFITKLSTNLDNHIKTVILASSDDDQILDVLVDTTEIYALGTTYNYNDFGMSKTFLGLGVCGYGDIFITRLDTSLNYINTTIICGSNEDYTKDFIKANGSFYLIATTYLSYDLPIDTMFGTFSLRDVYLLRLNLSLDTILMGVLFAGPGFDNANNIITDNAGNVYISANVENSATFGGSLPRTIIGNTGNPDVVIIKMDSTLSNFLGMVVVSSPDTDRLNYGNVLNFKGDTLLLAVITKGRNLGGSDCTRCDITSGDTSNVYSDVVIVGLDKNLSACIGAYTITGDGDDRATLIMSRGDTLLVGGLFLNSADTSSYPQPYIRLGNYGDYHEGFIIKVSPRCLVNVEEKPIYANRTKHFSISKDILTLLCRI
ncbi:MAG: hypothetical protein ABIL16_01650 [candidate division WOR-3 bacterium]